MCYLFFVCLLWNSVLQWTHLGIIVAFQTVTYLSRSFFHAPLQNSLSFPKVLPISVHELWELMWSLCCFSAVSYRCLYRRTSSLSLFSNWYIRFVVFRAPSYKFWLVHNYAPRRAAFSWHFDECFITYWALLLASTTDAYDTERHFLAKLILHFKIAKSILTVVSPNESDL